MTLGGLLALGYNVVVSYKRASTSVIEGNFSISLETIDTLGETYLVLRGINRERITSFCSSNRGSYNVISQASVENKGLPVIVGIGGPSGSGKTSLARKMANIVGCEVVSLESYYKSDHVKDFKYDEFSSLDLGARSGFKELEVSEECGVVIFEGVNALHPDIRKSLDLWIAVVGGGGVHSHLLSRVQRDKSCFMSQNEIMTTVFPMFQQYVEPHLVHAHLKIRNDFDPVLSPESSLFVLKSNKQVAYQDILRILDHTKILTIRVIICEGRFTLLIRKPIREGNYIIQSKVDVDISISTVAGLLNRGYQAVAYIEASAYIYQDGKLQLPRAYCPWKLVLPSPEILMDSQVFSSLPRCFTAILCGEVKGSVFHILIEVDHLQDVPSPYIQIKGVNKEVVAAAGSTLKLDGSYTTKSYLQLVLERLPSLDRSSSGIHSQQAARLQELVEYIQSQFIFRALAQ
ncbi:hypothetical protein K7X08_030674 [Anisodus acutangulus]|uniref:Phosphoribulokinase/uridine kinase domain-containing protein n=1 Tax=Anisodus acutangulus TaxID=402998 RepID=A0A9Q1M178_9SOLA|nr:hypothetical protein K7X08_030674 [Anisodus acutangulus]